MQGGGTVPAGGRVFECVEGYRDRGGTVVWKGRYRGGTVVWKGRDRSGTVCVEG